MTVESARSKFFWLILNSVFAILAALATTIASLYLTESINVPEPRIEDIVITAKEQPTLLTDQENRSTDFFFYSPSRGEYARSGLVTAVSPRATFNYAGRPAYPVYVEPRTVEAKVSRSACLEFMDTNRSAPTGCRSAISSFASNLEKETPIIQKIKLICETELAKISNAIVGVDQNTTSTSPEELESNFALLSPDTQLMFRSSTPVVDDSPKNAVIPQIEEELKLVFGIEQSETAKGDPAASGLDVPLGENYRKIDPTEVRHEILNRYVEIANQILKNIPVIDALADRIMSAPTDLVDVATLEVTIVVSNFGDDDLIIYPDGLLTVGREKIPLSFVDRSDVERGIYGSLNGEYTNPEDARNEIPRSPQVVKDGEAKFIVFSIVERQLTDQGREELVRFLRGEFQGSMLAIRTRDGLVESEITSRPTIRQAFAF